MGWKEEKIRKFHDTRRRFPKKDKEFLNISKRDKHVVRDREDMDYFLLSILKLRTELRRDVATSW